MRLAAIVPVWNGRPLVEKLLASLAKQTLRAEELVVVDNGSTDGAPEAARACGARVIGMGRNAGFAAAVNRGIRETRAEWIAVLNSDVELAPDYFALLTASSSWFATGRILAADDPSRIDGTFDLVCRGGTAWRAGSGQADGPAWDVRARSGRRRGPRRCFEQSCSRRSACWRSGSNRTSRMWISGCAARR